MYVISKFNGQAKVKMSGMSCEKKPDGSSMWAIWETDPENILYAVYLG